MKDLSVDQIHGKLGQSPNKLYKNYVAWFKQTYKTGKTPLTFKAWLEWAKNKGVIMSADGGGQSPAQSLELKIREIQLPYVLIGAGLAGGLAHFMKSQKIGLFVAGGAVLGAIVSLMIPKIQATSGKASKSSFGGGGGSLSGSSPIPVSQPIVIQTAPTIPVNPIRSQPTNVPLSTMVNTRPPSGSFTTATIPVSSAPQPTNNVPLTMVNTGRNSGAFTTTTIPSSPAPSGTRHGGNLTTAALVR